MDVLMLGWEFPPHISGGLGTACHGLTKGLGRLGTRVIFVLPHEVQTEAGLRVKLLASTAQKSDELTFKVPAMPNVLMRPVNVRMYPYSRPAVEMKPVGQVGVQSGPGSLLAGQWPAQLLGSLSQGQHNLTAGNIYSGDLFRTMRNYCASVAEIAQQETFDVIHAHDWMTFAAGVVASKVSGKPLVVHVHSTEFDRHGDNIDQRIYDIEREGMHCADRVIAVSRFTKRTCVERYGVSEDKVCVVYNAVQKGRPQPEQPRIARHDKVVLFLGRITMQKGLEYFLAAAKKVLARLDNVKFIVAGAGDALNRTIELAADLGIGHKVLFSGFLRGSEVDRAFRMADLYVMPSVSEPFGITPLEALSHNVPVIISKQSGVSEVLTHALKVDFWDVDELANKMIAVLTRLPLQSALQENGAAEVRKFDWAVPARQCTEIYCQLARRAN